MQREEFLIKQNEERIDIIDFSIDLVRAYIVLGLTEDKNEMKEKLERAFEIAKASLMRYTKRSFSVDGLMVKEIAMIEEVYIYDEEQKNTRYIVIDASKKLLDKAKETAENILQLK